MVGGGIVIILCLIGLFYCIHRCKNRPLQSNTIFVHETNASTTTTITDINLFKSGSWSIRYLHAGIWHGPNSLSLSFDCKLFEVTGSGTDEFGIFIITGTYSTTTCRMGLMKIYRTNHFERRIIIQVIWNSQTRQFEGKQYLQCKTHREENRLELKFNRSSRIDFNQRV